jgi:hypothetical protein
MRRFFRNHPRGQGGRLGDLPRLVADRPVGLEVPVSAVRDGRTLRRQGKDAVPPHPVAAARRPPARPIPSRPAFTAAPSSRSPGSLLTWYLGLIPHWTGARPRLKARLLLRTHQWIVERVLAPEGDLATAVADLRPDGDLARILTESLPAENAERWRRFIRILVAHLRQALLVPVTRRNEAWVRWLFLVSYRAAAADPRRAGMHRA